jgi:hypothetical protein
MTDFYDSVWWWRDKSKRGCKYERWYDALMEKARKRGKLPRGERQIHHPIPKVFGGKGRATVHLTFREHFIAHLLLIKFTKIGPHHKMLCALGYMATSKSGKTLTSWEYETAMRAKAEGLRLQWENIKFRRAHAAAMSAAISGDKNPAKRPEVRAKISVALTGNTNCPTGDANPSKRPENRVKSSARMTDNNPMFRPELSGDNHANKHPEMRAKISASHLERADEHWTKTPDGRATRSRKQSDLWNDPEYRAQQSAARKIGQAKRREREAATGGSPKRPDVAGDRNPMRNPEIAAKVAAKISGDASPTKRPEVRAAMREAQQRRRAREAEAQCPT